MNPKYPVYIISKGRWESRLTAKSFESLNVPYKIVVEPQEYENYASVINSSKILTTPFSNLGKGSIPVRNWVWEHAVSTGAKRHWILDDNINGFVRLNRNERHPVSSGTIFRAAEDFVDRYENVALAGFEYRFFSGGSRRKKPPYRINTRIYSCILIKNDIKFRWRGIYNEDTDLSLRVLKSGLCTVMFNAFLCNKAGTMSMKGGNTDELYSGKGRLKMAQSLANQHPDVVSVVKRFGRDHHLVDYRQFASNRMIKKKEINIIHGINNYGMILKPTE